ncbi:MAG TPA: hypothetical protein VGG10_22840 [Rhizomicrobium sp.]|jgi:hypothetical protein
MSAAEAANTPLPVSLPFEQTLYERSPVGTLATTAILFVLMFGSFVVLALAWHVPMTARTVAGFTSLAAWPALVLSLLCCTALAMQRYARLWEVRDAPAYARILTGGMASARIFTSLAPRDLKVGPATVAGVAIGLVLSVLIRVAENGEGHPIPPGPMIWFALATIFLTVLFTRGAAQTRAGGQAAARTLAAELKIDLLRTDTMAVLGRSAARTALIWFVVSAVACLFFVNGDLNWLTILLVVSSVAMGLAVFVSIMSRIHRQIVAVKTAELEHVRRQIDDARARMLQDDHAAVRMHGLLAYEKRIEDAQEWPFDQSTLVRVAAYVLIPTIPWFGQAVVQYYVDHLAH